MPPVRKQQNEARLNGLNPGRTIHGSPYNLEDYKYFMAAAYSEADGRLEIQESADANRQNPNWDLVEGVDISGGSGRRLITEVVLKFARVKYTNGANHSNQFRLYSVYKRDK